MNGGMNTPHRPTHPDACRALPDHRTYGIRITEPCGLDAGHTGCHVSQTTTGLTGWHTACGTGPATPVSTADARIHAAADSHAAEAHSHTGQAMAHGDAAAEVAPRAAAHAAHAAARLAHDTAATAHQLASTGRISVAAAERASDAAWIATAMATTIDGI